MTMSEREPGTIYLSDAMAWRQAAGEGDEAARAKLRRLAGQMQEAVGRASAGGEDDKRLFSRFHRELLDRTAAWLVSDMDPAKLILDVRAAAHAWWWDMQTRDDAAHKVPPCIPVQWYVAASRDAVGQEQIDRYFCQRVSCSGCGETYRVENIGICVLCGRYWCYQCMSGRARVCGCGGEVLH